MRRKQCLRSSSHLEVEQEIKNVEGAAASELNGGLALFQIVLDHMLAFLGVLRVLLLFVRNWTLRQSWMAFLDVPRLS